MNHKLSMRDCYILDRIDVSLDDVKQVCKKYSFDMDHFWIGINKRFNLSKSKNTGERSRKCGVPILVFSFNEYH